MSDAHHLRSCVSTNRPFALTEEPKISVWSRILLEFGLSPGTKSNTSEVAEFFEALRSRAWIEKCPKLTG